MRKAALYLSIAGIILLNNCGNIPNQVDRPEIIKSYCLDFNWGEGGPNSFAAPGLWADVNPAEQVKWYKDLGVNVIQTFIVSCNGYAWYKNAPVPFQPGLVHDYLPEMVKLGHKEGMMVLGYLCIGSNTRWAMENPAYSYGYPSDRHIPYTRKYLEYLDRIIRDAIEKTGIDGFMVDWFYQPDRSANGGLWLESEKQRYRELTGMDFPGEESIDPEEYNYYSRLAIEECWTVIHRAAKETDPDAIIWLTAFDITHPHYINSRMFMEADWIMNEEGDIGRMDSIKKMIGPDTRLITCLANWNKKDPVKTVTEARENGIGLYGFAKPEENGLLAPVESYLIKPQDSFSGDERNIACFARYFNGLPLTYIKK
jgi:hypothetical protein